MTFDLKAHGEFNIRAIPVLLILLWAANPMASAASNLDEFKVKRESVFAFAQRPSVTRNGDNVTIEFKSKGYCDATVVIEDKLGKIVRHLVSGVLGPNAPEPFQKNSLKQTVVWDGPIPPRDAVRHSCLVLEKRPRDLPDRGGPS